MEIAISVVIPTYNRARFVAETISSVVNQSFDNLEIIIVDDGSTDDTRATLTPFLERENVFYHYQSNNGRSSARNLGLERARGGFVMFLDSDDLLITSALQNLIGALDTAPNAALIAGRRFFVDQVGGALSDCDHMRPVGKFFEKDLRLEAIREVFFAPSMYMVRKDIAKDLRGFEKSTEPAEDFDFFLRCCERTKVTYIDEPVVKMRRHEMNTSDTSLRLATIRIGQQRLRKELTRELRSQWRLRIADDYYALNQGPQALRYYTSALFCYPRLLGGSERKRIVKQIAASLLPPFVKLKIKEKFHS